MALPLAEPAAAPAGVKRVLLVDDEPRALDALAELLRDEGYVVETAADGAACLSRLETFAPEAVVVDLELPRMSGLELAREVRAKRADLPVILMTGHGPQHQGIAALRAQGAVGYISKPVSISALVTALGRLR